MDVARYDPTRRRAAMAIAALAAVVLGCTAPAEPEQEPLGVVAESSAPGLTIRLSDQNKDGRNDSLVVLDGTTEVLRLQGKDVGAHVYWIEIFDDEGRLRFGLIDRNEDGNIDQWERRELSGSLTMYKDQDFDGSFDEVVRDVR